MSENVEDRNSEALDHRPRDQTEDSDQVKIEITPPEEEDRPTRKLVVVPVKEKRVSYAGIPALDEISEDGSTTSSRHDRSRKVSLFSSQLTQQQHRKLSCDPFLIVNQRKYSDILAPSRKFSGINIPPPLVLPSRKVSIEPLNLPGVAKKYSVISIGSDFDSQETFETLPHADHYRHDLYDVVGELRQRPTLDELRDDERKSEPRTPLTPKKLFEDELEDSSPPPVQKKEASDANKFGWIQGVLVRCLLNIFGVMLFLRLTWITGQAGIGLTTVIICLSSLLTTITTLSMSAICTNGEVKGGGAYYMISRSLGPEFGGSIGVVFSLANAIGAAMYIVGFAETVQGLMFDHGAQITGHALNDVRIIGSATSVLLIAIVIIGMDWEAKAQVGLLVILTISIINYFVGTFIPPKEENQWKGIMGYKAEIFSTNFGPDFKDGETFFSVFAIFFPAATGILAGANISGDLKDPQVAIPKGTILAILITTFVYLGIAWTSGAVIVREAVGGQVLDALFDPSTNTSLAPTLELVQDCKKFNMTCEGGLLPDKGAIGIASAFEPLILAGIFSATLSSALASMVGAPKVFQALGKDRLFPLLHFFAKGYGPGDEPRRGYILTFFICVAMVCIGELDLIAPIISNFFLMAYVLINYSCFDASLADSPGFRPSFKYYNKWISFVGSLLCLAVMFLINWWAALITFLVVGALYLYVRTKKPDVNWGSSTQAHVYRDALQGTLRLVKVEEHVKNFRPQILVLSGYPRNRPALVDFAANITKKQSLLITGHVFTGDMSDHVKNVRSHGAYKWFESRKIKAFYNAVVTPTLRIGTQVLLQALGIGKLRPNTLFLGYKSDWQKAEPEELEDYFNIIQDAFDLKYGVGILRIPGGFDIHKIPDESEVDDDPDLTENVDNSDDDEDEFDESTGQRSPSSHPDERKSSGGSYNFKDSSKNVGGIKLKRLNTVEEGSENLGYIPDAPNGNMKEDRPKLSTLLSTESTAPLTSRFQEVQHGSIDVWWLFDDGGLTLLIPYILSKRKVWKNCKLRIFCAGTKKGNQYQDEVRMSSLLAKFRIEYSQLTVIPDLWKKPSLTMYKDFESIIHQQRIRPHESPDDYPWKISDGDLLANKQKIYRNIKLKEQLLIHSPEASLIVMTLPVPKREACPATLYMGWLEMLSQGLPPMLFLRGNQENVLTYYS
ncbi:solute carrier family 12 member 3-like [Saccostrea cucullata]|uniref:solute carrier family 12 member 3-like n=1 Tax=Saccostrea cuccullata TaxID=36930 RepID=UPI002ED446B5